MAASPICEVKVEWPDVQQGPIQIFDTAFNLQKKHKECTVVPVLAIPDALERRLRRWRNETESNESGGTEAIVFYQLKEV